MKITLTLCMILLGTSLPAIAQEASQKESEKTTILLLENAWNEAEKNNDAKAIEGLLAPEFSYTESDGNFSNREQYLASIKDLSYHPEQIVNQSMKIQMYENAAVVTGMYRERGTENGKPYDRRGRFTDLWIKENGKWLCAASHETLIRR